MPAISILRKLALSILPCLALVACNGMTAYQYHGRLISHTSGQPMKDTTVYAGPESSDSANQFKTNEAGAFSGSFSLPSSPLHRAPMIDRIDIHYLTPHGWVILHHTLHPEDQDLAGTPRQIDLGTLSVPD